MFEYRRTPFLGLVFAAVIGFAVTWLLETPERPLTLAQAAIFYALSYLPGLGLAMLSDPAPRKAKEAYLKIDFYAPGGAGETGARAGTMRTETAESVPQKGGTHACR